MTTIIHTYESTAARNDALRFSTLLAVDKGVKSDVRKIQGGWLVVADDNRAVRFLQK